MALLAALLPSALALPACIADDICLPGTDPCIAGAVYEVGAGCVLDFGTRELQITGPGRLDVGTFDATLYAGNLRILTGGELHGRDGGRWLVRLSGDFLHDGEVDVSSDAFAGGLDLRAANVTLSGPVRAQGRDRYADGGLVEIVSLGTLLVDVAVDAYSGADALGGTVVLRSGGAMVVDAGIDAHGGGYDGGAISLRSGGTLSVLSGTLNTNGGGDAGYGGIVRVIGDGDVAVDAVVTADGDAGTYGSGGDGGLISVVSLGGNTTVTNTLGVHGAPSDGSGGFVRVRAAGTVLLDGAVDANATGTYSTGGYVHVRGAEVEVTASLSADGGDGGGGLLDVRGHDRLLVDATLSANGGGVGGSGGTITAFGDQVTIASRLDAKADAVGYGGVIDIRACDLVITQTGFLANDSSDGETTIEVHETALIDGDLRADLANEVIMRAGAPTLGTHASSIPPLQTTLDPTLRTCTCPGGDADLDSVCDRDDVCPGGDDLVDNDLDGWPDACPLTVVVAPSLTADLQVAVTVTGARPGGRVWLAGSYALGAEPLPGCNPLDIGAFRTSEENRAGADGVATFYVTPRGPEVGMTLYGQAWDAADCRRSAVVQTAVTP